jgi:hypothetical protein
MESLTNEREIHKNCGIGNLRLSFRWGDKTSGLGRFGGGWQWALGIKASRRSFILYLLVFSVMIYKEDESCHRKASATSAVRST